MRSVDPNAFALQAPEAASLLAAIGVAVDEALLTAAEARLPGITLAAFLSPTTGPPLIGHVWRELFLSDAGYPNDEAAALLVRVVLAHIDNHTAASMASLTAARLQFDRTRLYVVYALGCILHDVGRALHRSDPPAAHACFLLEIDFFELFRFREVVAGG